MFYRVLDDQRFHIPFILVLCLLLFFPFLAARDFWELENQYAEVVRVMLADGNYAVPKVNDVFWSYSPPLYFWAATVFSFFAGAAGEWAIRLPSALSATELIVVFYCFVAKRWDGRLAVISATVLATSVLTVHVERHIQVNMMFYLFITIAIFLLMEVIVFDAHRLLHIYGAWSAMALACLTNGPTGFLIPAIVALLYLAVARSWRKVFALRPLTGGLLFLGLTTPWFAYLAWSTPGAWTETVLTHFRSAAHSGPDHQVFFSFPLAFAPWCFLFIPAGIVLWRERSKVSEPSVLFYLAWFLVGMLASEASVGQHNHFLFLAYVPLAIGLGFYLEKLLATASEDGAWRWTRYCVTFLCAVLVLGGLSAPIVMAHGWPFLTAPVSFLGLVLTALAVCAVYAGRRANYPALMAWMAAIPVVINLVLQSFVFPLFNARKVRPFAERLAAIVRSHPGGQVAIHNQRNFHDFNFYSQMRKIEVVRKPDEIVNFLDRPGPRFLLLRHKHSVDVIEGRHDDLQPVLTGNIGSERWCYFIRAEMPVSPILRRLALPASPTKCVPTREIQILKGGLTGSDSEHDPPREPHRDLDNRDLESLYSYLKGL
jgi:4-amino-4-deoxy-L-arabinose transferase-like glycosyltransferase